MERLKSEDEKPEYGDKSRSSASWLCPEFPGMFVNGINQYHQLINKFNAPASLAYQI